MLFYFTSISGIEIFSLQIDLNGLFHYSKWKISTIPAKTKKSPEPETINGTSPVKFEQNGEANVEIKQPKKKEPEDSYKHGVISTIMKTYGFNFLLGSILKFIHDVLVFISPLLLRRIIGFAEDPCEQVWKGIVYALALLFTNFAQTIFMAKYFYDMYLIGMWIRTAVTSSIYRKSLRVSPQGKAETTTGEVVNLMSVDTQRLVDMMVRNIFELIECLSTSSKIATRSIFIYYVYIFFIPALH